MLKKLFIWTLVLLILWYDWNTFGGILEEGADLEMKYMKLFGSVSVLAILLYMIDREH